MGKDYLNKIVKLANVSHPVERPTSNDWSKLETRMGISLPTDYKNVISIIGHGHFGVLELKNPVSSSKYSDFTYESEIEYYNDLKTTRKETGMSFYPNIPGYVLVGSTDYGRWLFCEANTVNTASYKICWMDMELYRPYILTMSICQFIHDMYYKLIMEKWAYEDRNIIWNNSDPFFESFPGGGSSIPS
jgi:hypothetical protein